MSLDGNAIAGLLAEIFAADMTSAMATCAACGAVRPVANTTVYLRAPGTVVRCRTCDSILIVVTTVRGRNCVDLSGVAELQARPASD